MTNGARSRIPGRQGPVRRLRAGSREGAASFCIAGPEDPATMTPSAFLHELRARLERAHDWAHRGPVRSLVAKAVMTAVGVGVALAGVAMLVLPGPGLVVIGVGLAMLATEWPWARRVLHAVHRRLTAVKEAVLPAGASGRRRAAGGVMVAAFAALGFVATAACTALLGASTLY